MVRDSSTPLHRLKLVFINESQVQLHYVICKTLLALKILKSYSVALLEIIFVKRFQRLLRCTFKYSFCKTFSSPTPLHF
jgi:hypothetical protein